MSSCCSSLTQGLVRNHMLILLPCCFILFRDFAAGKYNRRCCRIRLGLVKNDTGPNSSTSDGDFYWLFDGSPYTFQAQHWKNTKYTSHSDACVVAQGTAMKWEFELCTYLAPYLCKRGKYYIISGDKYL